MMHKALFLAFYLASVATSFTVYDCDRTATTYKVIDLREPQQCPNPETDFRPPQRFRTQIIQANADTPVKGHQCAVAVTRRVTRCGYNSLTYGDAVPVFMESVPIDAAACQKMVHTNSFTFEGKPFLLKSNAPNHFTFFSHGSTDDTGACEVENFERNGVKYEKSYEITELHVSTSVVLGTRNMATGAVVFENGIRADFAAGALQDNHAGTVYWANQDSSCTQMLSLAYAGPAEFHLLKSDATATPATSYPPDAFKGAVVMVNSTTSDGHHSAGFVLGHSVRLCNRTVFRTQIADILLLVLDSDNGPLNANFQAAFDSTDVQSQSRLAYLHITTNQRMLQRFQDVQTDVCRVERKALFARLHQLTGSSNPHSLRDLFPFPHQVAIQGAAAYVTHCVPYEAGLATYGNCTLEMPVRINNSTLRFADPITYVLRDFPTIVPCDPVMPVRWFFHQTWYCSSPKIQPCGSPSKLATESSTATFDAGFTLRMGDGVYSKEQMQQHTRAVVASTSRMQSSQFLANFRTSSTGFDQYGARAFAPGLSDFDATHYNERLLQLYFPFILWFGSCWKIVMFGVAAYLVACVAFAIGCRTFSLYRARGCGIHLLAAVFESAFVLTLMPFKAINKFKDAVIQELPTFDHLQQQPHIVIQQQPPQQPPRPPPPPPQEQQPPRITSGRTRDRDNGSPPPPGNAAAALPALPHQEQAYVNAGPLPNYSDLSSLVLPPHHHAHAATTAAHVQPFVTEVPADVLQWTSTAAAITHPVHAALVGPPLQQVVHTSTGATRKITPPIDPAWQHSLRRVPAATAPDAPPALAATAARPVSMGASPTDIHELSRLLLIRMQSDPAFSEAAAAALAATDANSALATTEHGDSATAQADLIRPDAPAREHGTLGLNNPFMGRGRRLHQRRAAAAAAANAEAGDTASRSSSDASTDSAGLRKRAHVKATTTTIKTSQV